MQVKLINLIGKWLKEEKLNAPNTTPSSTPHGPSIGNATEIETVLAEASEQQPMVEVDEETVASNPLITDKGPASRLNLEVATVHPLINLEEEPEVVVNLTAISISSL